MNVTKVFKQLKLNLSLAVLFALVIFAGLVAFPSFETEIAGQEIDFNGIDFTDLSGGKIVREFKLNPTLDFYGGTEVVYQLGTPGAKLSRSSAVSAAQDVNNRLINIGLQDYDLYVRQTDTDSNLVVRLPKREEELQTFNQFLGLKGNLSFVVSQPVDPENADPTAQPSLIPVDIERNDIESVTVNFGSETGGNGLIIKFKQESVPKILVNSWSDINSDINSRLILQLDDQPVAGQAVQVSSASTNPPMYFTTGLFDDELSTTLLKEIIVDPNLSTDLQVIDSRPIEGVYDRYADPIRITFLIAVVLLAIQMVILHRTAGLISAVNFAFVIFGSIAIAKILGYPISIVGIIGLLVALGIWIYDAREVLPLISIRKRQLNINEKYVELLTKKRKNYRSVLLLSAALLIGLEYTGIPEVHVFGLYFITVTFIAWLAYLYAVPASLNLVKQV